MRSLFASSVDKLLRGRKKVFLDVVIGGVPYKGPVVTVEEHQAKNLPYVMVRVYFTREAGDVKALVYSDEHFKDNFRVQKVDQDHWVITNKPGVEPEEQLDEIMKSRPGKKRPPNFPMADLTITGQLAFNTIFKHLKDGKPDRVNFDGGIGSISGVLIDLKPNDDYFRVSAEWPDDQDDVWTSHATWHARDFNNMKLKTTEHEGQKVLHVIKKGGQWDEAA